MNKISVVIPTIGESFLTNTIDKLLNGSLVPDEIIIVIPKKYSYKIQNNNFNKHVKIFIHEHASQVSQRIFGFKKSINDIILQLDADILIEQDCLKEMVNALNEQNSICISPRYSTDIKYKLSFFKKIFFNYFIKREKDFNNWDTWFTRHYFEYNSKMLTTKWLPGGCILHRKHNLVLENYYQFNGKAFDEDLIHSFMLSNNSIKLCIAKNAFAKSINYEAYEHKNFNELFRYIMRIYKIKKKLVHDSKGNIIYFHIWFIQWFLSEQIRFLKSKLF